MDKVREGRIKYGEIKEPLWNNKHSGSDWIEAVIKKELPPFGAAVADLLGQWQRGIYHIQKEVLHKRVKWEDERYIEVVISDRRLCTHDANDLTRLVFLCHDYGIRVELYAAARRYVRLVFYNPEQMALVYPHPTLREAVGLYRYYEGGENEQG